MAANVYLAQVDMIALDGWVRLSETSLVMNFSILPLAQSFTMRYQGGPAVKTGSYPIELKGVDLADFEMKTTSGTTVSVRIIGYSRQVET